MSGRVHRQWWFWLLVWAAMIAMVLVTAGCGTENSVEDGAAATGPSASPPQSAPPRPGENQLADGGWQASDIRVEQTQFGLSITARVTNTQSSTRTGLFTLTLFKDGATVATASGAANDVEPGQTATVTFVSSDNLTGGTEGLTYQFQSDL